MKQGIKIRNRCISAFLLVLFLLPAIVQISHTFSDHDHPTCSVTTTHLHKLEKDCSISDFHFTAFNFTPLETIELFTSKNDITPNSNYTQSNAVLFSYSYLLRGPPHVQLNC